MEDLLLLGIDTSGKTASAALFDSENGVFLAQSTLYTQKTHSQVIMPMCREIIAQAGKKLSDIGTIAVANGPGSYTGLRIGVAAVKAMCFALDIRCCGVSTLEGLAWNNIAFRGLICSVMKARGELVYTCTYRNGWDLEPICSEQIVERSALVEFLKAQDGEILLCGDGAEDFFRYFRSEVGGKDSKECRLRRAPYYGQLQNAAGLCIAACAKQHISPDELEVSYLQKVKAEKDLEKSALTDGK